MATVMLCSVFFAYADWETKQTYSDQKDIILEKAQDDTKTIWELKESIKELNEEKAGIDDKVAELKKSSDLWAFFKDQLSEQEITEVAAIIKQYKILNTQINRQFAETAEEFKPTITIKSELLEERKNLYKRLVPYIKIEKIEEYKQYIAWDASYLIEKKEVDEDIARKEWVIEQKVEKIEEKIEENKRELEESLKIAVSNRVDEYLDILAKKEKFIALPLESRINIVDSLISKLEDKVIELRTRVTNSTSTVDQKITILETIVLERFENFKNNLF